MMMTLNQLKEFQLQECLKDFQLVVLNYKIIILIKVLIQKQIALMNSQLRMID